MIADIQKNHCMNDIRSPSSHNTYIVTAVKYTVGLWKTLSYGKRMNRYEKVHCHFFNKAIFNFIRLIKTNV